MRGWYWAHMQFTPTLDTGVRVGGAVRGLELQIDVGAVGALLLDHPTQTFLIVGLTSDADVKQ